MAAYDKLNPFAVEGFAERLSEKLERNGLNQNQLAQALGISRSAITGWIRHGKLPDSGILAQVCAELDCSADWLLGLESYPEKADSTGAIRWIEQTPSYISGFQREQIEHGIRLFNQLVGQNRSDSEIIKDHNLQYLQFAIQAAFRSGALRLVYVARDEAREERIKRRYPNLKDVVVAAIPAQYDGTIIRAEVVAFLAATDVLNTVVRESAVGLGAGYTILRMCEQSIPSVDQFRGTKWLPLAAYADEYTTGYYTPNQLARLMEIRHPGSDAVYLPHPALCVEDTAIQGEFKEAVRLMDSVQTVFLTVNGVGRRDRTANAHSLTDFRTADYAYDSSFLRDQYAAIEDKSAFGAEMLGYLLDDRGQIITWDRDRIWQIDLDILRYNSDMIGKVCIVAARDYKAQAVETCLRNGLANALVIDSEIAAYLVK